MDVDLGPARNNIVPTEDIALVRRDGAQEAELVSARWWLTPHWAKEVSQKYAMFNARSEGLSKSPAFRKPFASQRGIVPMSSFIEWRGDAGAKQPWLITTENEGIAVAALWDLWRRDDGQSEDMTLLSCTLVTTEAAPAFKPWHNRMPVMLDGQDCERWLDNSTPIDSADPIFAPTLCSALHLTPIDKSVGNSRNKAEGCLEAVGEKVILKPDSSS